MPNRPTLKLPRPPSKGEAQFALLLRVHGFPEPVREFVFAPPRRWRFDFAWPGSKVAVEIEGLVPPGRISRHTSNAGFIADAEKYNHAAMQGWKVLRFAQAHLKNDYAIETTAGALGVVLPARGAHSRPVARL